MLKADFRALPQVEGMSFPVARPDRRLLSRRRWTESCLVEFGAGETTAGVLAQLDPLGARVRILGPGALPSGDVRIVMEGGDEVFGRTAWRLGSVLGVRRHARSRARRRAFEPS